MLTNPPSISPPLPAGDPEGLWTHHSSPENASNLTEPDGTMPLPPWTGRAGPIASRSAAPSGGRRFAALSTLPESLRLPPKRDTLPARHQRESPPAPAAEMQESQLPAIRPPAAQPPATDPGLLPAPAARQMGFNCPACFTVLIIRDPSAYDGRPAPCPTCGNRIVPPRVIPDSPFRIVERQSLPLSPNSNQP